MNTVPIKEDSNPAKKRDNYRIPVIIFVVLLLMYLISSRFIEQKPIVTEISPSIAAPGDILIIKGKSFGDQRSGAEVVIGGIRPNTASYIEWSDKRISIRIPENAGSGDVIVKKRNGSSNGILFTNKNHIPVQASDMHAAGVPLVSEIVPNNGAVGETIILRGINFGELQGEGVVYFSSTAASGTENKISTDHPDGMIPCSNIDYDYLMWSDQEIRIHVPFGATSGNIIVKTDRGESAGGYFEVSESVGTMIYSEPRGYQIQYAVGIENVIAGPSNEINIWVSGIYPGLEQQNIESLSDPEPVWVNFYGIMRYALEELEPWRRYTVLQTFWFDRYRAVAKITPSKIDDNYDTSSKFFSTYTSSTEFIPSDLKIIKDIAFRQTRRVRNPYNKAKNIYSYLLNNFSYDSSGNATLEDFISSSKGDSYDYARLFTALCRSVDIPTRIVSGVLVYGNKNTVTHYWNEFFIPEFGWFPLDATLGDGAKFGDFPEIISPDVEYFGSLDNQHITFSRGFGSIQRIDPGSTIVRKDKIYSLQTIHEEAVGNIQSYDSLWSPIRIIDLW